ncbi:FAD-dependent oxidoreductase [Streptomyces sannanensis]|uniref:NAD(P)/FAD-dependent oxidoreductase n=1 Tax=Streptomyces sannanensis TaxID=285536 RepID=UPI0031E6B351
MPGSAIENSRTYDAIIVGNGALGLSLGLALSRQGVKTAVVGEASRPFAASAAAGAMNGCFGEATPGLLQSEYGRAKLAMDVRATSLWTEWEQQLVEESDEKSLRSANGTIVILNTIGVPEIDSAGYSSIRAALDEYHEPYEDLDPEELDWLDPDPVSRPLKAMFIPNEHALNTQALLRGLATAFTRAQGTLVDAHVTDVRIAGDKTEGVVLSTGEILSSPSVVIAAGAASRDLLGALPQDIRERIPGMVSGYGVALLIETAEGRAPDSVIRTPNRAFACGLHAVPRENGRIYLGATNNISPEPRDTPAIDDLNLLLGCTRQLRKDLVDGRVDKIYVGNRPVPLDGFPLLGEAGVDGLWLMTGTYRDGLHQSPLLAQDFAARLTGKPHDTDLDVFTPLRAPIQAMSREECLEAAVQHTLALGYEHDWGIPVDWPPVIEDQLRRLYSEALDEFDPAFTPPPELLASASPEINEALHTYYRAYGERL